MSEIDPDETTRVACDIDLHGPGKRFGTLRVPWSRDESAWGSLMVPVVVISGGEGPTAVLSAGAHGDEYEGPVILGELARALTPEEVRGRLVILPAMNVEGLRRGRRLAPADGKNLNRCYPGRWDGASTEALTHFVSTRILPEADVVLDMHSGGKSLEFVPCALRHRLETQSQEDRTQAAMDAFGAPTSLVIEELDAEGMIDTVVERSGKVFLSTELGGGGVLNPAARQVGEDGVWKLLAHEGLISKEHPEVTAARARAPEVPLVLEVLDDGYVLAPERGVFECLVELGESVHRGAAVGRLHFPVSPEREPMTLAAPVDGVLVAKRAPALSDPGDCLAVLGAVLEGA